MVEFTFGSVIMLFIIVFIIGIALTIRIEKLEQDKRERDAGKASNKFQEILVGAKKVKPKKPPGRLIRDGHPTIDIPEEK